MAGRLGRDGRRSATSAWPVEPANVAGRISGALLGFWLNGRITFAGDEHRRSAARQLQRFVLHVAVHHRASAPGRWARSTTAFGLQWAWLAKPAVELVLGVFGFVLSRHWVYRP